MEQSITTPQITASSDGDDRGSSWLLSALAHMKRISAAMLWYGRRALSSDASVALDVDGLSVRLAVETRARADGAREQPSSTEEVVTGAQREIVSYFRRLQRKEHLRIPAMADKLRRLGDEIGLNEAMGRIRDIPSTCENEIRRLNAEFQSQLELLGQRAAQQQHHYESFRETNKLNRFAEYPRSFVTHYSLLAALIFSVAVVIGNLPLPNIDVEASVDSTFAVSMAVAVALVPFVVATTAFRSINHVRRLRRMAGWLTGSMSVAFVALLAFFFAHYTSSLATEPAVSVPGVVESILAAPTAIDVDVVILSGSAVLVFAGLLALLLGYRSDDAYPGYGAVQRAFYKARQENEMLVRRLRKRINAIVDNSRAEVAALPKHLKGRIRRYSKFLEETKRMPAELRGSDIALEDACNILLDRYRAANVGARRTPAPASFSEHVCFRSDEDSHSTGLEQEESRLQEFDEKLVELEAEALRVSRTLKDLNWSAVSALGGEDDREDAAGYSDE